MSELDRIPVVAEQARDDTQCSPLGLPASVNPILQEIRYALERLIANGEEHRIDLSALPCGPADLERLTELLGTGEVQARVEALGPTLIQETAVPGVWFVDYQDAPARRLVRHIEIALVPQMLRPQPQDLEAAITLLDARCEQETSGSPPQSREA